MPGALRRDGHSGRRPAAPPEEIPRLLKKLSEGHDRVVLQSPRAPIARSSSAASLLVYGLGDQRGCHYWTPPDVQMIIAWPFFGAFLLQRHPGQWLQ